MSIYQLSDRFIMFSFPVVVIRMSITTALLGLIAHAEMSKVFAGQRFLGFHCTP